MNCPRVLISLPGLFFGGLLKQHFVLLPYIGHKKYKESRNGPVAAVKLPTGRKELAEEAAYDEPEKSAWQHGGRHVVAWALVKGSYLSHHNKETVLFTINPYYAS